MNQNSMYFAISNYSIQQPKKKPWYLLVESIHYSSLAPRLPHLGEVITPLCVMPGMSVHTTYLLAPLASHPLIIPRICRISISVSPSLSRSGSTTIHIASPRHISTTAGSSADIGTIQAIFLLCCRCAVRTKLHIPGQWMRRQHVISTSSVGVVLVSSPESEAPGSAGGVAVCGGGAKALLALVISGVEDLKKN